MKVILMRHGETDSNRDGIWMGRELDVSINETGKTQLEQTISLIKPLNPEVIIASPLRRTRDSAEVLGNTFGIPVELDDRLIEVGVGSLSGKTRVEAAKLMSLSLEEVMRQYRIGQYDYTSVGGESAKHIFDRSQDFLNDLSKRKERCVIIMTHGGIVRSLHELITGDLSFAYEGIPNASVLVLEYV